MRFSSISNVVPGDILGQDIYDYNGYIMLKRGVSLTRAYINKLIKLGVTYLYILDSRLSDVDSPMSLQLNKLKEELARSFYKMHKRIDFGLESNLDNIKTILNDITDFIIHNKGVNDISLGDLKTHDNYTYIHSLNTTLLSLFLGTHNKIPKSQSIDLGMGAFLHDIGKVDIPLDILNKCGKLTDCEYNIMKNHPIYGYNKSRLISCLDESTRLVILEHHERIDGSGYPFGKTQEDISIYSKIVAATDVYDALTSDRQYRKAFPHKEAYEHMLAGSGSLFDENIINIFQNSFYIYPIGIKVRLSNNCEGFVVKNNAGFPDKPIVRIFTDEYGQTLSPYEINLTKVLNVCVEKVIS